MTIRVGTVTASLVLGALSSGCAAGEPDVIETAHQLYVNPTSGADTNAGSEKRPFRTIQAALDQVVPDTTIHLAPGTYRERLTTKVAGREDAPIVLLGPESGTDPDDRNQAVVTDTSRIVNIDHSHYVLDGFTIDGQPKLKDTTYPRSLDDIDAFKRREQDRIVDSKLLYVGSSDTSRGITGVTVRDMFLTGAGGECVRLRNGARDNTIVDSVIQYCGMYGKSVGNSGTEFHNGEGVYIGTSPGSDDQPMAANDAGSGNAIRDNVISTFGTECLDVKENAHDNVFEDNTCSDNTESTKDGGSLVELRGFDNVVRNNQLSRSRGYGVKIRSDEKKYDKGGNVVTGNRISDTAGKAIFIKSEASQGEIQ